MIRRRQFLVGTGAVTGLLSATGVLAGAPDGKRSAQQSASPSGAGRAFNGQYQGENLAQIAFPLGGMGAGMFCLEGTGALSKFSLQHHPELERERRVFAAVSIKRPQALARVLEGPVPIWKLRPQFPGPDGTGCWGLPRFHEATFEAQFPFATVQLRDAVIPLEVTIGGWSPFSPGDADNASLPVAGLEYRLVNRTQATVDAIFSFNAENILAQPPKWPPDPHLTPRDRIRAMPGGFILYGAGSADRPWDEGSCAVWVDEPSTKVNHAWRLDSLDLLWREFASGEYPARDPLPERSAAGASLFVPINLAAGEAKTIIVHLAWYVPRSNLYEPTNGITDGQPITYTRPVERYQPWYAGRFSSVDEIVDFWNRHYQPLQRAARVFSRTLQDSTLPSEVMEAVTANLSILKSTTVLRQPDGRLWGWEGSNMESGETDLTGVSGTTTHVWNYAQAIAHLFPELERGLRETELGSNQNDEGLQYCRTSLPIRAVEFGHTYPDGPAADGQLGGIIKVYRDWRISGDTAWLRRLWPRVRASLDYCIRTWDPSHRGWIEEPHLNTYDMEFWGADSLCTSLYLGALKAAIPMAITLGQSADLYSQLLRRGAARMEGQLFNGEYFSQSPNWKDLRAPFPPQHDLWALIFNGSQDLIDLEKNEGPLGQIGIGCLSDGVMGAWLGMMSGVDDFLDSRKITSHLTSVHRYNLKRDLTDHANFERVSFACNDDSGLLLCTWPKGGRPPVPMMDSDEVWTGVEYQVASHLIALGKIDEGLEIVNSCRRRYDGRVRNPFDEVEAGHWYARALSSYALLQAFSGARFDAVEKVLHLKPAIGGDFRCFLSTATGYGTVGIRGGKPFVEIVSGTIPYREIRYTPGS